MIKLLERILGTWQEPVLADAPVGERLAREYGWVLDVDGIDYQDDKKAWWL